MEDKGTSSRNLRLIYTILLNLFFQLILSMILWGSQWPCEQELFLLSVLSDGTCPKLFNNLVIKLELKLRPGVHWTSNPLVLDIYNNSL